MNELPKIIIDAYCLAHRAKHTTGKALPKTGVIYGFFTQLGKIVENIKEFSNIIFCWDSRKSIRKQNVSTYKSNRGTEEYTRFDIDCFDQFSLLRSKILPKLFNNSYTFSGYEADDLIASILKSNSGPFITVSKDNDLLQLLDSTDLYDPQTHKIVTKKQFLEDTGLQSCAQWCEVKALGGCVSDHVIGISGIAEITAIKYLTGTASEKMQDKIELFKTTQEYKTNQWLVTLPLPGTPVLKFKDYIAPQLMAFIDFCSDYKIRSLSPRKWMDLFKME